VDQTLSPSQRHRFPGECGSSIVTTGSSSVRFLVVGDVHSQSYESIEVPASTCSFPKAGTSLSQTHREPSPVTRQPLLPFLHMPSLFTKALCCCCLRTRSKSPAPDDDRSRLIPPESEVPSYAQPQPIAIDHQNLKERLGAIVRTKEGKMLNVGASSPLNLHRKSLQAKLNPSASNSSVLGHRSFYSSNKSVTLGDHGATDFEGDNNHHPHLIPRNSSLVSFRTEESPSRDGRDDRDQDQPTVLNIRLANGGVYGSDRSTVGGRFAHQTYVGVVSGSEERHSRSSAPSYKTSVSKSRSPSLSRVRHEAIVREPAVIARSWNDE